MITEGFAPQGVLSQVRNARPRRPAAAKAAHRMDRPDLTAPSTLAARSRAPAWPGGQAHQARPPGHHTRKLSADPHGPPTHLGSASTECRHYLTLCPNKKGRP